MPDKAAERRRKRREKIIRVYKAIYCEPLVRALLDHNSEEIQLWASRGMTFKQGVSMADPNGNWINRFNKAYEEVKREMERILEGETMT